MSQPITAPLLAQALAMQKARPSTPTNQQLDPCVYGGVRFMSPERARIAKRQQEHVERLELRARIADGVL